MTTSQSIPIDITPIYIGHEMLWEMDRERIVLETSTNRTISRSGINAASLFYTRSYGLSMYLSLKVPFDKTAFLQ